MAASGAIICAHDCAREERCVTAQQAAMELTDAMHAYAPAYAKGYDSTGGAPDGMVVHPMQHDLTQGVRPALLAVLGAVLLVLLIACVNVANLLLARGSQRGAEFAMRSALGAPQGRIARQLVTECLLLATLGCALGMAVAEAGVRALLALKPAGFAAPQRSLRRWRGVPLRARTYYAHRCSHGRCLQHAGISQPSACGHASGVRARHRTPAMDAPCPCGN